MSIGERGFLLPFVGQGSLDAPADQSGQRGELQKPDGQVGCNGSVQEGDEDQARVFKDPGDNELQQIRGWDEVIWRQESCCWVR